MTTAIVNIVQYVLGIVLWIFGKSNEQSEKKRKEAEAVVNEVLKYENSVDTASDVRLQDKKLDLELEKAYAEKFGEKPSDKPL